MIASLSTMSELETLLRQGRVDTRVWGTGNAKTLIDLWRELGAG